MPLAPSAPIEEQPIIWLERWRVIEADSRSRHFVGFCIANQDGRVSTPIKSFDEATKSGVTASGRRYILVGPSGFDDDAEYVWKRYSTFWGFMDFVDVSGEYSGRTGEV